MSYIVYENRVQNYASVHRESCSFPKMHGGVSSTTPPTGQYHEGLETVESAWDKANSTGRRVRICRQCKPPISEHGELSC